MDSEEFGEHRSVPFIRIDRAIRLQHIGIADGFIVAIFGSSSGCDCCWAAPAKDGHVGQVLQCPLGA